MEFPRLTGNGFHGADLHTLGAAVTGLADHRKWMETRELVFDHLRRTLRHTEPALAAVLGDDPCQKTIHLDRLKGADLLAEVAANATGSTDLLDGRTLVVGGTEDRHLLVDRKELDNIFRTGGHTIAAARTLRFVDHGKSVGTHGNGIEGTGPGTGPEPETTVAAGFTSAGHQHRRPAVGDPMIEIFLFRRSMPSLAKKARNNGIFYFGLHTEDLRDDFDRLTSPNGAATDGGAPLYHRLGHAAASGKTTPPTVRPRQGL